MRKAFNFYNSYYEVAKELNDKDRLAFLDALLKKQFENIEPNLNGMVKFAYLSQKHSIDTQVKGYFDKTKDPIFDPTSTPTQGGTEAPTVQEKEKEKEKEEVQYVLSFEERKDKFLNWFNLQIKKYKGELGKFKTLSGTTENNFKKVIEINYSQTELENAFKNMWNNKWVQDSGNVTPTHFLRLDNLEKYVNSKQNNDNVYIPQQDLN